MVFTENFSVILFFFRFVQKEWKERLYYKTSKNLSELLEVKILREVGRMASLTVHFKYING